LVARLPRGRVIGVDGSPKMVAKARERLGDRAEVFHADLAELDLREQVDVIFSNAVFHWIPDHDRLFARLHAALRPGGRLVAQCGGEGNVGSAVAAIREVAGREPYAEHFKGFGGLWNFASDVDTAGRLEDAGFESVKCWLQPKAVRPDDPFEYMRAVTLGPHLARLPADLHKQFVEAIIARMGEPLELDYVRLNIEAVKPA
jgi:trans-aconitate 2-methyltransferase